MYSAGYDDLELSGLCLDAQAAVDYVYSHTILSSMPIARPGFSQYSDPASDTNF